MNVRPHFLPNSLSVTGLVSSLRYLKVKIYWSNDGQNCWVETWKVRLGCDQLITLFISGITCYFTCSITCSSWHFRSQNLDLGCWKKFMSQEKTIPFSTWPFLFPGSWTGSWSWFIPCIKQNMARAVIRIGSGLHTLVKKYPMVQGTTFILRKWWESWEYQW